MDRLRRPLMRQRNCKMLKISFRHRQHRLIFLFLFLPFMATIRPFMATIRPALSSTTRRETSSNLSQCWSKREDKQKASHERLSHLSRMSVATIDPECKLARDVLKEGTRYAPRAFPFAPRQYEPTAKLAIARLQLRGGSQATAAAAQRPKSAPPPPSFPAAKNPAVQADASEPDHSSDHSGQSRWPPLRMHEPDSPLVEARGGAIRKATGPPLA